MNNFTGSQTNKAFSNTGGFSGIMQGQSMNMMGQNQSSGQTGQIRGFSPSKPKWKQSGNMGTA